MRRTLWILFFTWAAAVSAQSDPYQWVGVTSLAFDGTGNGLGFVGMTTQCRADFGPGARMCRSSEILDSDTLSVGAVPEPGCWVRPTWRPIAYGSAGEKALDESGRAGTAEGLSCAGWASANPSVWGLVLQASGGFKPLNCDIQRPVACCAPTPVPEPASPVSLFIGSGALVTSRLVVARPRL